MIEHLSEAENDVASQKLTDSEGRFLKVQPSANNVLDAVFDASLHFEKYCEEDKRTIAAKVANIVESLLDCLEYINYQRHAKLEANILRKRSAIQFLYDDFGSVLVDGKPLQDLLNEKGGQDIMKKLDAKIEDTKHTEKVIKSQNWGNPPGHIGFGEQDNVFEDKEELLEKHKWWKLDE